MWVADEYYQGWTVGTDCGHFYDSTKTALREARGEFAWVAEQH